MSKLNYYYDLLDNKEDNPITKEIEKRAKEDNVIIFSVYSDDMIVSYGSVSDEHYINYRGGVMQFTQLHNGKVIQPETDPEFDAFAAELVRNGWTVMPPVTLFSLTYTGYEKEEPFTITPSAGDYRHITILEDGDIRCIGCILDLNSIEGFRS